MKFLQNQRPTSELDYSSIVKRVAYKKKNAMHSFSSKDKIIFSEKRLPNVREFSDKNRLLEQLPLSLVGCTQ